jgi:LacI family transcriptional regulator
MKDPSMNKRDERDERKATAGIKEMAAALGLSLGTIDRALHGRRGVSEATKARVLQMAQQLGYKPNLAARSLKLNRRLSIAAILPRHISHFFDPVRSGIRAAAAATVGMQVSLQFHDYPRLGVGDIEAFNVALDRRFDGIIFLPGNKLQFDPLIGNLSRNGTAMMCVCSDAPSSERAGSVATHAAISGALAAELLSLKLKGNARVAIITGELSTLDHAEKLRGFASTLAAQSPHLGLPHVLESHEQPEEAHLQTLRLMKGEAPPQGIYVCTANSLAVLRALDELKLLGKVQVVTTDLFHELVPLIENGSVMATIYQRPYTQGKLAFDTLLAILLNPPSTPPVIRLAPHVIFRSNLPLFSAEAAVSESGSAADLLCG